MSDEPLSCLSGDQVMAPTFAAHRQRVRWSKKPKLTPHQRGQRSALTGAVRILQDQASAGGCELRVPDAEGNDG